MTLTTFFNHTLFRACLVVPNKMVHSLLRSVERESVARSHRLHMVLNKVDNVIVQLPHVSDLRHQQVVAPPQPIVVLRERSSHGHVIAAAGRQHGAGKSRTSWPPGRRSWVATRWLGSGTGISRARQRFDSEEGGGGG
ncbi:heat shock transcription factor B4 [Actinidia rufa]|uniref:Heat shock transcription factor B4 n=1 Tax=Actinidia rufa TaxID=165716 RepID=A0A7J0E0M1_9ERIC|nr:heat shock transcription factor B4 [Actinidia rufa]